MRTAKTSGVLDGGDDPMLGLSPTGNDAEEETNREGNVT
jgi:hypothetical protein